MNQVISDHLSSVVAVTDASGLLLEETRYMPFGQVRSDIGTITGTDKSFTGQKSLANTGLLDYNARMYSSELGRFTQPDTIIPGAGNPQAWNRYSYTLNNPVIFSDPSGHRCKNGGDEDMNGYCLPDGDDSDQILSNLGNRPKQSGFDPNILLYSFNGKGFSNRRCNYVPVEFRTTGISYCDNWPGNDSSTIFDITPTISQPNGYLQNEVTNKQIYAQGYFTFFNPEKLSKLDVYLDFFGMAGDVVPGIQLPAEGAELVKVVKDISTMVDLVSVASDLVSIIPNDSLNTDMITSVSDVLSLVQGLGFISSLFDIAYQISLSAEKMPYSDYPR